MLELRGEKTQTLSPRRKVSSGEINEGGNVANYEMEETQQAQEIRSQGMKVEMIVKGDEIVLDSYR